MVDRLGALACDHQIREHALILWVKIILLLLCHEAFRLVDYEFAMQRCPIAQAIVRRIKTVSPANGAGCRWSYKAVPSC